MKFFSLLAGGGLFFLWLLLFIVLLSPSSEDLLLKEWKTLSNGNEERIFIPFLEFYEKEGIKKVKTIQDLSSFDALCIPPILTSGYKVFAGEEKIFDFSGEDSPSSRYMPFPQIIKIDERFQKKDQEISIFFSYKTALRLNYAPFLGNFHLLERKKRAMDFFNGDIFLLVAGIGFFLFFALIFLSKTLKEGRASYIFVSFSSFCFSLFLLFYQIYYRKGIPISLGFYRIFIDSLFLVSILSSIAGIEIYLTGNLKKTKYLSFLTLGAITFIILGMQLPVWFLVGVQLFYLIYIAYKNGGKTFIFSGTFFLCCVLLDVLSSVFPFLPPISFTYHGIFIVLLSFGIILFNDYKKSIINLKKMGIELCESNSLMTGLNEELDRSNKKMNETLIKFEKLIYSTTSLIEIGNFSEKEFFTFLLKTALELVPEADYGSISIIRDEDWIYVSAVGHDLEKLKKLNLKKDYFENPRSSKETQYFDANVFLTGKIEENNKKMPKAIFTEFKKAVKETKDSLVAEIVFREKVIGYFTLDIALGRKKEFGIESFRVIGALGSLAAALMAFQKLAQLEEG